MRVKIKRYRGVFIGLDVLRVFFLFVIIFLLSREMIFISFIREM